ncbi:MAG: hypothetical protein LIR50_22115 [Bacillota bacterium]|nr:hypothetical protein [Bacillota bacterium]
MNFRIKYLLVRWFNLLNLDLINSKKQVKEEIANVLDEELHNQENEAESYIKYCDNIKELDILELYEEFLSMVNCECDDLTAKKLIALLDAVVDWYGGIKE